MIGPWRRGGGGGSRVIPAAVTSVFGRIAAVAAVAGDYAASLVTNDSSVPGSTSKDALNYLYARSIRRARYGSIVPTPGTSTVNLVGAPSTQGAGTLAGGVMSSASYLQSRVRVEGTTASSAGANAGQAWFFGGPGGWLSRSAGFEFSMVTGLKTLSANCRFYAGINSGTNLGLQDPKTLLNMLGLGAVLGSGNMKLWWNDGAGSASELDLGSNFPVAASAVYKMWFSALAGASAVDYVVERLDVAASVSGQLTTDLPLAAAFSYPTHIIQNNTDAAAVANAFLGFDYVVPYA